MPEVSKPAPRERRRQGTGSPAKGKGTNGASKTRPARPDVTSGQSRKHVKVVKIRRLSLDEQERSTDENGKRQTVEKEELKNWEELEIEQFVTEPAYVRVNAGVTKQLRDYESLRMDVSVTMPCYREKLKDTYEYASDFVAELLSNEVEWYVSEEMEGQDDD